MKLKLTAWVLAFTVVLFVIETTLQIGSFMLVFTAMRDGLAGHSYSYFIDTFYDTLAIVGKLKLIFYLPVYLIYYPYQTRNGNLPVVSKHLLVHSVISITIFVMLIAWLASLNGLISFVLITICACLARVLTGWLFRRVFIRWSVLARPN